ncbi:Glutamine synthetase [bioreactor metagenome]|uniref:Glutamine synthetase n=1 Tax=bioreactor metagenome TaxID=1076179 RepID=A0A645D1F3_9ZZZZ
MTHKRVIFNGNNYSDEWRAEAAQRKLPAIDNIVDAINVMAEPNVTELFKNHCVLDNAELNARRLIALRSYVKHTQIEAVTMLKLAKQKLFPACVKYLKLMTEALNSLRLTGLKVDYTAHTKTITDLSAHINDLKTRTEALDAAVAAIDGGADIQAQAIYVCDNVRPNMTALRDAADALVIIVDKETWPMPSYGEMMFNITNC